MRTLILFFTVLGAYAQSFEIRLVGANTDYLPVNWPIVLATVKDGTKAREGCLVVSSGQLDKIILTNTASYNSLQAARMQAESTAKESSDKAAAVAVTPADVRKFTA